MKETEFRIGNLLSISERAMVIVGEYENIFHVTGVSFGHIYSTHIKEHIHLDHLFEQMNPIPLTEEWMLKFGLRDINKITPLRINQELDGRYYIELANNKISKVYFKYVHQLQNLYFALTGEELCPKP